MNLKELQEYATKKGLNQENEIGKLKKAELIEIINNIENL